MKTLLYDRSDAVGTVTLNRPEALNALNSAMFDELEQLFTTIANDDTMRVVLLTGAGDRAFAAGADIRELVATDARSGRLVSERGQGVLQLIASCGKTVIACVNGAAFGGGLELALACTFRLASESAQLGFPEVKLGLIPGYGGTQRLPRQIGAGPALHLMLTGQSVKAADALRLGLMQEVLPAAELMPRARALAALIAGMAPLATRSVLEAVQSGLPRSLKDGCRGESEIFGRLCGTADKHEGLSAFLAKRPAVWQGR